MNVMTLIGLRPRDNTAAAIAEAITSAAQQRDTVRQRVAELETRRADLLLSGSPTDLAEGEAELASARAELDRLDAMHAALTTRHADAERTEAFAALEAARTAAEEAAGARSRWWKQKGPKVMAEIEEGRRLSDDVFWKNHEFTQAKRRIAARYPEAATVADPAQQTDEAWRWRDQMRAELATD